MKTLGLAVATVAWAGQVMAQPPVEAVSSGTQARSPETVARAFISELQRGDLAAAHQRFSPEVSQKLSLERLHAVWEQLGHQFGELQVVENVVISNVGAFHGVDATTRFLKGSLVLKLTVSDSGQIAGFFVQPASAADNSWQPPDYALAARFKETPVQLGGEPVLPGFLTVPKAKGAHPVVILVHGSGPLDADETVLGHKVFKDIAWGLASRGVAVLRYDKRTHVSPSVTVTVKEEVLDGVREAIALVRRTPELDSNRIVVAGHSQGGYLAPRIVSENPGLAGVVLLAGSSRPLQDSALEQFRYFQKLHPGDGNFVKLVGDAVRFKSAVEGAALSPSQELALPGGAKMTGAYFLSLRGYVPAVEAANLKIPILVIQGGRDYQVTTADLEGWKKALEGQAGVQFRLYPKLNHLFTSGDGPSTPEEYRKPGHVDAALVNDLADWIAKLPPARAQL